MTQDALEAKCEQLEELYRSERDSEAMARCCLVISRGTSSRPAAFNARYSNCCRRFSTFRSRRHTHHRPDLGPSFAVIGAEEIYDVTSATQHRPHLHPPILHHPTQTHALQCQTPHPVPNTDCSPKVFTAKRHPPTIG